VLAAMDDVAGETAEAERQFAAEKEKRTDEDDKASEDEKRAAEFAEGVHENRVK